MSTIKEIVLSKTGIELSNVDFTYYVNSAQNVDFIELIEKPKFFGVVINAIASNPTEMDGRYEIIIKKEENVIFDIR